MISARAPIRTSILKLDQQLALVTARTTMLFNEMTKLNLLRDRFRKALLVARRSMN
jgi:hypothetical protein